MKRSKPPPETHDAVLYMRVAPSYLKRLDALRRAEDDLPSRSEMVRRLIDRTFGRRGVDVDGQ